MTRELDIEIAKRLGYKIVAVEYGLESGAKWTNYELHTAQGEPIYDKSDRISSMVSGAEPTPQDAWNFNTPYFSSDLNVAFSLFATICDMQAPPLEIAQTAEHVWHVSLKINHERRAFSSPVLAQAICRAWLAWQDYKNPQGDNK